MRKFNQFLLPVTLLLILVITGCSKDDDDNDSCNDSPNTGFMALITDPCDDHFDKSLLDGTRLEYKYQSDSLYFLISVNDISANQAFGANVMINIPNGGDVFNFFGDVNTDAYHKIITVFVTGSAPSNYTGDIGIGDADGLNTGNFTNVSTNNISIEVDADNNTILLGVDRKDFITDAEFPGNSITVKVAAAVGSNEVWNDDIYNASASMTLNK